jgi:predicted DNA-binding transcriptional regulator YafY
MTLFQQIDRIEHIHYRIRSQSTGEPNSFAEKLNLGRRQLYNLLDELKDYGAKIRYSRTRQTFFYERPFQLAIKVEMKTLSEAECEDIFGGRIVGRIRSIELKTLDFIFF